MSENKTLSIKEQNKSAASSLKVRVTTRSAFLSSTSPFSMLRSLPSLLKTETNRLPFSSVDTSQHRSSA